MKAYKEYMDEIHVSPELHNRLVKGLCPPRKTRRNFSLVAAAACVATMLFAAWILSPQISQMRGFAWLNRQGSQREVAMSGGTLYLSNLKLAEVEVEKGRRELGVFYEDLSLNTARQVFGGKLPVPGDFSLEYARAGFNPEGELVNLVFEFGSGKQSVAVIYGLQSFIGIGLEDFAVSTVNGIEVGAGYIEGSQTCVAYFQQEAGSCYIEAEPSQELLVTTLESILESGLNPNSVVATSIPEWRHDSLTMTQAQEDIDFGSFVPDRAPNGFSFASAYRILDQGRDLLIVNYKAGMNYIELSVSKTSSDLEGRFVNVSEPETYNLSLYSIPWMDSVPDALWEKVTQPVFYLEDLTQDVIRTRAYQIQDSGDSSSGYRMNFSVISRDVVVSFNVKGSTPEDVFSMLKSIEGLK